jgi:hypothetical protein
VPIGAGNFWMIGIYWFGIPTNRRLKVGNFWNPSTTFYTMCKKLIHRNMRSGQSQRVQKECLTDLCKQRGNLRNNWTLFITFDEISNNKIKKKKSLC